MKIQSGVHSVFVLLTLSPIASAQGTSHRILEELQSVYPYSAPGPVTSTPEAEFIFTAESGVLAVIDASTQGGFECPIKIESISSQGVRAVELLLDPDAVIDEENAPALEDVLYVAGGRFGLWAVSLDLRTGYPMRATRIDEGTWQSQTGNTWCNSLEIMTLGETPYLVALFAHEECSRLRVYSLSAVRNRFDSTLYTYAETGNEVATSNDVGVGGNCSLQTPRYGSFGYGMTVEANDVYVAMGRYGLVRARFASISTVTVTAGPYFGSGSYYDNNYGHQEGHYTDFEFRQVDPTDDTAYVVTRQDPPMFVDVVVSDDGENHLLWAAVDHLGIVAFDLEDTWASASMPIAHQEGLWVASSGLVDTHIELVDETENYSTRNYAHRLSIVDTEEEGPVLAVGLEREALIQSDSILDEGRTLGHLGLGYQGTTGGSPKLEMTVEEEVEYPSVVPPPLPSYVYTVLYDVDGMALVPTDDTGVQQHAKYLREGGRPVHLPSVQPQDELLVVGSHFHNKGPNARTFLATYAWPPQGNPDDDPDTFLVREMEDRPGWRSYDITYSRTNPELLYLGSCDHGTLPDGILATCGNSFVNLTEPDPCDGEFDNSATFGIQLNPHATWEAPEEGGQERDFIFGAGKKPDTTPPDKPRAMLVYFDPGEDVCASTPTRVPERRKTIYVESKIDNFLTPGRGYYEGSSNVSAGYDGHIDLQALEDEHLHFISRASTPAGVWVVNRSTLEGIAADSGTTDHHLVPTTEAEVYYRELNTHPEFDNVYYDEDPPENFLGPTTTQNPGGTGLAGRVITFFPQIMEMHEDEDQTRWVLAVPCGAVQLPHLDTFTENHDTPHPEWAPDEVYDEEHNYDHAMVRVFDVDDYDTVTLPTSAVPVCTLLGPRPQCSAVRVEPLNWTIDSENRSFLFVTNFTDSVMVWEITDLFGRQDRIIDASDDDYGDFLLEEWITPPSISDDLPNNPWHIAVVNEVWNDGQTNRNEVYVYVAVGRYGIQVLRFLPGEGPGDRLEPVRYIRTPSGMGGLCIGDDGEGGRTLRFAESLAGLRTFIYPQ